MWLSNASSILGNPLIDSSGPMVLMEKSLPFAVLCAFIVLMTLEVRLTRGNRMKSLFRRSYRTNFTTFLFNDVTMSLLSLSALLALADRHSHGGLLSELHSPLIKIVLSFFLFDLVLYLWHKANHRFAWLWMFHKVHHSDRAMNVSTAFRLHFVELFLTTLVKAIFIVAMGVEAAVVATTEAVITLFVMFHHANIAFRAERWLSRLIIVPSLHRVHHSALREKHDSNYGATLSLWDRIFGSLRELQPREIGLRSVGELNFWQLLRFGFSAPLPAAPGAEPNSQALNAMIAEAAYYKAQLRGFVPGFELIDWVEAEKDINHRVGR